MAASSIRQPRQPSAWVSRNRWRIGLVFAALVGGGYIWHRGDRRRRIEVDRVSQQWLAQREFDAGQHPDQ